MEADIKLTVKCEECRTEFVPDYLHAGPVDVDRDSDGGRGRIVFIRFVPICPACNAVVNLLRRANLGRLADRL